MNIKMGNPNINTTAELLAEIGEILTSGWVSIGSYMERLEEHFRDKTGVKFAIATSCATTGLIIAIKAAGWKHKIIALPAFTWPSTLYALECNQNEPLFCDIEKGSWLMEYLPEEEIIEKVISVDVFGNQSEMFPEREKEHVIYDAAHGYDLPNLGKRGLAEVVSLSFTKIVTGMEGGMILTDDEELAETAIELRRLSGRMEEVNALIALNSIKSYNEDTSEAIICKYKKNITVPHRYQTIPTDTNNSVFSILLDNSTVRDVVRIALAKAGCETKVYYDPLCDGLPNTDYVYSRILSLPIHEGVIPVQDEIIEIINTSARGARTPGKDFLTK